MSLNTSGFKPYDIGVLIRIKEPEEKKTKGGLILTSKLDAVSLEASQNGVLVDVGPLAFKGQENVPQVGDQVFFAKYAGQMIYPYQSEDEQAYRVMDYHDIRLIKTGATECQES